MTAVEARPTARSTTGRSGHGLTVVAAVVTAATVLFVGITAVRLVQAAPRSGGWHWVLLAVAIVGALAALLLVLPVLSAVRYGRLARAAEAREDPVIVRRDRFRGRNAAWLAIGLCVATAIATFFVVFLLANDHAVQSTFFAPSVASWRPLRPGMLMSVIRARKRPGCSCRMARAARGSVTACTL